MVIRSMRNPAVLTALPPPVGLLVRGLNTAVVHIPGLSTSQYPQTLSAMLLSELMSIPVVDSKASRRLL
jgi:hypothetical protein